VDTGYETFIAVTLAANTDGVKKGRKLNRLVE
jgi:hypothetical protein